MKIYTFLIVIPILLLSELKEGDSQSSSPMIQLKSSILQPDKFLNRGDTTFYIGRHNNMFKVNHVSKDFIFNHYYGHICKWETKRDNKKRQKVRFRLGDPSYVDKLEGK